jgi:hypothetical protein
LFALIVRERPCRDDGALGWPEEVEDPFHATISCPKS